MPESLSKFGLVSKVGPPYQGHLAEGRRAEISRAVAVRMAGVIMLERLLDSVILIDHFNDIEAASAFIAGLDPGRTAISVITYAEILVGFEDQAVEDVKGLLSHYEILGIDAPVAEKAAELRRRYGWKLPDAFQAGLALHHRLRLCTRNTKDFNPKMHSFVEVPYRLRSRQSA